MDPYIYFITEYSHLASIPMVAAALYIGWRKGLLGLEGTAGRNLIGVGGLGLVGFGIFLGSLPPPVDNRGSFRFPSMETLNRCDSDTDCTLVQSVTATCCRGCERYARRQSVYSNQEYRERLELRARACGLWNGTCPRAMCGRSKSKSQGRAKCVDHRCKLVETPLVEIPWTKADSEKARAGAAEAKAAAKAREAKGMKGGKQRPGKRKAGKQHPARGKRGKRP